jgi:hypothetical protein
MITGMLKVRLTNLEDPTRSIVLNIPGPGSFDESGLTATGPCLFCFLPAPLFPAKSRQSRSCDLQDERERSQAPAGDDSHPEQANFRAAEPSLEGPCISPPFFSRVPGQMGSPAVLRNGDTPRLPRQSTSASRKHRRSWPHWLSWRASGRETRPMRWPSS